MNHSHLHIHPNDPAGAHDHLHENGHHNDPRFDVQDTTKCIAEGCANPATLQRSVTVRIGDTIMPVSVPICQVHYDLIEEHNTAGLSLRKDA